MVNKATVDRVAIQERIRRELPEGCFPVLFKYLKAEADYKMRYVQGTVFKKYAAQVRICDFRVLHCFWAAAPEGQMTYDSTQGDFLRFPFSVPPPFGL